MIQTFATLAARWRRAVLAGMALATVALAPAQAAQGQFSTLTYNVAGLPQGISSAVSDRSSATRQISCYINGFDIVHVQEDFNYHAALYDTCNNHPYRSPTTGGVLLGSGLNVLSRFPYTDFVRVKFKDCNDVDCLSPKGFTLARMRLSEGVEIDVYNLHAQAQTTSADLAARRKNILQLVDYIETNSAGRTVIVMGDTNTRYTRSGDNMEELLVRGFKDVWNELYRGGNTPVKGSPGLACSPQLTSANCEIVDKVLYRDNGLIGLAPYFYNVRQDAINSRGQALSDHPPVEVHWSYNTRADRGVSDPIGFEAGMSFHDQGLLPGAPSTSRVSISTAARLIGIEIGLSNGFRLGHGGASGHNQHMHLAHNEYLVSAWFCSGKVGGVNGVAYAELRSSFGQVMQGGTKTAQCKHFEAPPGWQIVGFHGRASGEVHKIGVIYAWQLRKSAPAIFSKLVNAHSGLCLDVDFGNVASGSPVKQFHCTGADFQQWNHDAVSGLIRNAKDPRFCLDNGGWFWDGAKPHVWWCMGNANQRFDLDMATGRISVRSAPWQVLEVKDVSVLPGAPVQTGTPWGGGNQAWRVLP